MTQPPSFSIAELRAAYRRGENITKLLNNSSIGLERSEVIEVAYDVQSGSYTQAALENPKRLEQYALEISDLCKDHWLVGDVILDCGAGELTTLSALSHHLPAQSKLLACDISLSRLRVGRRFAERVMKGELAYELNLFVADMACMPLADSSVDVVFTSHALEPNHGREAELLGQLLRIARRKLLLFEPSWENATPEIKSRMEEHGYVRDLPKYIEEAGGGLVSVEALPNSLNSLNPTFCYVVEKKANSQFTESASSTFSCPRSGTLLYKHHGYWWSAEGGWAYPEIDGIACLRTKHGVLMSHE